jgi:hypothetical protein
VRHRRATSTSGGQHRRAAGDVSDHHSRRVSSHLFSRVFSTSSCSRRLLSRMRRASLMFPRRSLIGTCVLVDRVGCAPMLQDKVICGSWLSVPRENYRMVSASCTASLSMRLRRFRYIVFASGSPGSGMEWSIMAVAAMFCVGLRKYCAMSLLLVSWSYTSFGRGLSASRHLRSTSS